MESIKAQSETVGDNYDKIEQVATISANNDPVIGKLIADAMRKVSKDGVITIEEAKGGGICCEKTAYFTAIGFICPSIRRTVMRPRFD